MDKNKFFKLLGCIGLFLSIYLMIVGKSIILDFKNCQGNLTKINKCFDFLPMIIYLMVLLISFELIGMILNDINHYLFDIMKNNIISSLFTTILAYTVIILAHGIGYPIVWRIFEIDEFFTWITFTGGLMIYLVVILILFPIYLLYRS